jgi:hypothetical protein
MLGMLKKKKRKKGRKVLKHSFYKSLHAWGNLYVRGRSR